MNSQNLPVVQAIQEADYLIAAAREASGMGKIMTYNKGEYYIGTDVVPLGTEFIAYCDEWVQRWIKYGPNGIENSKVYVRTLGQKPVERSELGDNDKSLWPPSKYGNGELRDPWGLQDLVPFESRETGEIVVFRNTSPWGGRKAVGNLCLIAGNMKRRDIQAANGSKSIIRNPIIRIRTGHNPSQKFGKVPCPVFEIVGWDMPGPADTMDVGTETRDEIPF